MRSPTRSSYRLGNQITWVRTWPRSILCSPLFCARCAPVAESSTAPPPRGSLLARVCGASNPAYVGNAYGHCTRLVPAKSRRSPLAPVGAGLTAKRRPKKSGSPSRSPRSSNGRPSIWSNIHPRQEERHEVLSGTLWGRVGGQEQVLQKGRG